MVHPKNLAQIVNMVDSGDISRQTGRDLMDMYIDLRLKKIKEILSE
jgi:Asp-tRNA(Asn)/Glu-tRNA(Gln) amidotransferase B subunit